MVSKSKWVFTVACLVCLAGWFQNCSAPSLGSSTLTASSTPLYIASAASAVAPGGTIQFIAGGGTAYGVSASTPTGYNWSTQSTLGYISPTGLFTAGDTEGILSVYVTDAAGASAIRTVTITSSLAGVNNALTATISPAPPGINSLVTITATGGTGSYTYTLTSGSGTLVGNQYQEPGIGGGESAVVVVTDSSGAATNVYINSVDTTSTSSNVMLTAIAITGSCPSGMTNLGGVMDGSRNLCAQWTPINSQSRAISYLSISGSNIHASSAVCGSGYYLVGSFTDCGGGVCSGVQSVCATYTTGSSNALRTLQLTSLGLHAASGPGCSVGIALGSAVDCGGGYCSGFQQFCASY